MDFETILDDIYGNGLFHVLLTVICSTTAFVAGLELQSIIYMHFEPNYKCSDERLANGTLLRWISRTDFDLLKGDPVTNVTSLAGTNSSSTHGVTCWAAVEMNNTILPIECTDWTYDQQVIRLSIVTQFNLVCGQQYWVTVMESMYLLSNAAGFMIASCSDFVGRRGPFIVFAVWEVITCVLIPFSSYVQILLLLRICRGITVALTYMGITVVSELAPLKHRAAYGNVYWLLWSFGQLTATGLYWTTKNWLSVRWISLAFLVVYATFPFIIKESPRWLCLKGRIKEAVKVLHHIARWNKAKLPENYFAQVTEYLEMLYREKPGSRSQPAWLMLEPCTARSLSLKSSELPQNWLNGKTDTLLSILTRPNLLKRTITLCFMQSCLVIVYFGLMMESNFSSTNIYLNGLLMGLSELPSSFLGWGVSVRFGRRSSVVALLLTTSLTIIAAQVCQGYRPIILQTIFATTCKLALTVAYCVADLYLTELFPTSIRSTGFNLVVAVGRLVSTVAPFINQLGQTTTAYLPTSIYATMAGLAAMVVFLTLPETKYCPLAQTVDQAELLVRGKEEQWAKEMSNSATDAKPSGPHPVPS